MTYQGPVIIFAIAMGVHAVGVDHTIREIDPDRNDQLFRYLPAVASARNYGLLVAGSVGFLSLLLIYEAYSNVSLGS